MHVIAFALALVGGLAGFFSTLGLWFVSSAMTGLAHGLNVSVTEVAVPPVAVRLVAGFAAVVVTIVGGTATFARRATRRWALVLVGINIVGKVATLGLYLFGGLLGLVAGLLALKVQPAGASGG